MADGYETYEQREARRQRIEKELEADRKARAPTVGGSLKEGGKQVLERVMRWGAGGGEADRMRDTIKKKREEQKKEIDKQTGD